MHAASDSPEMQKKNRQAPIFDETKQGMKTMTLRMMKMEVITLTTTSKGHSHNDK